MRCFRNSFPRRCLIFLVGSYTRGRLPVADYIPDPKLYLVETFETCARAGRQVAGGLEIYGKLYPEH